MQSTLRWLVAGASAWTPLWAHPPAEAPLPPLAIRWLPSATPPAVEVDGLSQAALNRLRRDHRTEADWRRLFPVFAEQPDASRDRAHAMPPMAGTWRVTDGHLRFEPRFPPTPGVRYRAEYRPVGDKVIVTYFESLPSSTIPTTSVLRVFPSAGVLPENQLKFYVEFSAAMSRGGVYEHVHLRNAAGQVIDLPFLELDEELWDPSMTRLTLLIDPGRIKRGVKPLEDVGPVFEAGESYALRLDAACRDAGGRPLRATFEKKFRIGPADRVSPDPQRWHIGAPAANTREPLTVDFDESMDQALALRLIGVTAETRVSGAVRGDVTLTSDERRWTLVPDEPWQRGSHQLVVATTIEDLAGNNIGKTFDVDLAANSPRRTTGDTVSVTFEVR
jgi:hypothetical protein